MSRPRAANWIAESTTTVGTGDVTPAGQLEGFAPFSVIPDGTIYYTLQDGLDKECGIGTIIAGKIQRTTVFASLINDVYASPGAKIDLSGYAEIYCTVNADLFNEMGAALDKLDGIEDGATADQVAAEVPYDPTGNLIVTSTDVQGAIDELSTDMLIYSAAVSFGVPASNVAVLVVGYVFAGASHFIDPTTMNVYVSPTFKTGTVVSWSNLDADTITIVADTGSFNADKSQMATQDWVNARESAVMNITAATNTLVINPNVALTYNVTLTQPNTAISFSAVTETAGTQKEIILILRQGSGANKVTWSINVDWAYNGNPVLSFNINQYDMFSLVKLYGQANWIGSTIGGNYGQNP